ncbi:14314_t:CDS:2, partial [Gigaspora rosea]
MEWARTENGKRIEQVEKENSKSQYFQSQNSEPKNKNSREGEEADISKLGIKNISVHSKKWNPKYEEASGSTNEEIEETIEIKQLSCSGQRGGGSPTLLKVATGVNKRFCETEVSQAQKMSQNKKGQY